MSRTYHHGNKKKERMLGNKLHLFRQEPKLWRKYYKHKKRRAEWKRCKQQNINGVEWDNIAFPLNTKPWIYYL